MGRRSACRHPGSGPRRPRGRSVPGSSPEQTPRLPGRASALGCLRVGAGDAQADLRLLLGSTGDAPFGGWRRPLGRHPGGPLSTPPCHRRLATPTGSEPSWTRPAFTCRRQLGGVVATLPESSGRRSCRAVPLRFLASSTACPPRRRVRAPPCDGGRRQGRRDMALCRRLSIAPPGFPTPEMVAAQLVPPASSWDPSAESREYYPFPCVSNS